MTDVGTVLPSRDAPDPYDEDEIDVRKYVLLLWRYRIVIVAATLVCAALAAAQGLATRRVFSAYALLAINQLKSGAGQTAGITTASYRPILESQNLAARIVQEFGLDRRGLSVTGFFGSVVNVEEIRNSTVFILKAQFDDPNLAARVVNRTAELAVEESRRLNQDEASRLWADIKTQRDDARARVQQAEDKLVAFKNTYQIELLRQDVDSALQQRGGLLTLLVQIETEKARLANAEQELANRRRIDTVKRSIDTDAALMESPRKATGQPGDVPGLPTSNESIDSVYKELDSQVVRSRMTLAALERQREQLVEVRKLDAPRLAPLTKLYDAEAESLRLQAELDLTKKVYEQVVAAYETTRLQVAGRSVELQIVEPALPPDRPLSRNVARNTAIAAAVGFVLSALFALAYGVLAGTKASTTS